MINDITMAEEECKPSINIAPYMSKFVRSLHVEEDHPILKTPFSYTQFGAVLMVDIVGFSQMTSIASSKGDVGAEMLSSQIGAYFDMAIRIIEYHGGDIVKFLGDALLVVFQADPSAERLQTPESTPDTIDDHTDPFLSSDGIQASSQKRDKIAVRKAIECSLELLTRLSNYRIYLSQREFSRRCSASSSGSDGSNKDEGGNTIANTMQGNEPTPNGLDMLRSSEHDSRSPHHQNITAGLSDLQLLTNNSSTSLAGSTTSDRSSADSSPQMNPPKPSHAKALHNAVTRHVPPRLIIGTGPGAASIPALHIIAPTPTVASKPYLDHSNIPTPISTPAIPGGVSDLKRREGLIPSGSSRPGSATPRMRAGLIATAKHLFGGHSNPSDKQAGNTKGEAQVTEAGTAPNDAHELQLHMALSAGDISNIIIGDIGGNDDLGSLLVQNTGRLEYAICGEQMSILDHALSLAKAGEVTITASAQKYVNTDSYPSREPRGDYIILRNPQQGTSTDLPLLRRVRNDRLLNVPVGSNPHYFKYINKSAIHRLILNPDGAFPAQFRNATILFVSLGDVKPWTPEGLSLCQRAMVVVQKVTAMYEGFIQQFAVDDKGATILCAFGLPYPRSHEKEAVFAVKSAWLIRQQFLEENMHEFRISLATGVIFTSTIGNEFRRDPAIVGDTIVIAVRILKFEYAKESIICDDATMHACTCDYDGLCEFEDMGEEYVKGKVHPLKIWRLLNFGAKKQLPRPDDISVDEAIGYKPEREKVANFLETWSKKPDRNTVQITGPRGSGKRMFHQQICRLARHHGFQICCARSVEVERNTEYYPIKFLLLGIFDMMRSQDIPFNTKDLETKLQKSERSETDKRETSSHSMKDLSPISTYMNPPSPFDDGHDTPSNLAYMDLSPNLDIAQYSEFSENQPSDRTKLEELVGLCLDKVKSAEDGLTMPVLNRIIAAISVENASPMISKEDDQILSKFIVCTLNYAAQFVKIIVILEDIQWCDGKSLSIIQAIHEECPSVLVVIFSRPQRDYGCNNVLNTITSHSMHLQISLVGLKRKEIEQTLLQAFRASGVNRISPDVLELVQEKTKGNPKLVKSIAMKLRDFCHVNIVDGELLATGKDPMLNAPFKSPEEKMLQQDRKMVTSRQYDRLSPRFQGFLKIASCLGEKFSLAEVGAIKPVEMLLGAPDGKTYGAVINELDTYRFLSLATEQQTNMQFSSNPSLQTIYMFTSPSTASDIYESIPYEERVGYHLKMGLFYESFLDQKTENEDLTEQPLECQDLLPHIRYHYMRTNYTEKKIKYLKALAEYYLKSNMLTDATDNINGVIQIIKTEPDSKGLISEEEMADIYRIKGESLSKRMRVDEAEPALLECLAMYGIKWPSTKSEWKRDLLREWLKFKYFYARGLTPVPHKAGKKPQQAKGDAKAQIRLARLIRVFVCLQNIYFWRVQTDYAMLSSLYTLSYSRKLGLPSGDQTIALGRIGIVLYYQGNRRGFEKYMKEAWRRNNAGDTTAGMLEAIDAYAQYGDGHQLEAHRLLDIAINESKTFGVVTHLASFYRAVTQKAAYRMWEGAFNTSREDCQLLRSLSVVAIQNGDSEGETLFAIPTLGNLLLQNRFREAESWVVLVEKFIMPKARLINLLTVYGVLAFYYAKIGYYDKARRYTELHSKRIEEQGIGAHPFPLMSCLFTLMALYEIHNRRRSYMRASVPELTIQTHGHGVANVSHMIAYLKTDPLKLISEPLICLADAMGSFIIPGNEKEGGRKLIRGYSELSASLEGIQFLKAFFMAQLCRHSEPSVQGEYYRKAFLLFQSMSMDPSIWLTDPSPMPSQLWLLPKAKEMEDLKEERTRHILDETPMSTRPQLVDLDVSLRTGSMNAIDIAGIKVGSISPPGSGSSGAMSEPRTSAAELRPAIEAMALDETDGHDTTMGLDTIDLDENLFDDELATAAVSSAPIAHDM